LTLIENVTKNDGIRSFGGVGNHGLFWSFGCVPSTSFFTSFDHV